jgi:hypothetical protein
MTKEVKTSTNQPKPRLKCIISWAVSITSAVFAVKFIPRYLGLYGFSLAPLFHRDSWRQIATDVIWALPVGLIIIILGLFGMRRKE